MKIQAELPDGTVEMLARLAEKQNTTVDQALKQAIATHSMLEEKVPSGQLFTRLADGSYVPVLVKK